MVLILPVHSLIILLEKNDQDSLQQIVVQVHPHSSESLAQIFQHYTPVCVVVDQML